MDTVKKILSAPIVSIPLGIAVFIVVIGGSLGDFYQFAHGLITGESCPVWLGAIALATLVLVSGLYFFLNSPHNLRVGSSRANLRHSRQIFPSRF
jgi:hypothetical protein